MSSKKKHETECVYCGKRIDYSMDNFKMGKTGEPSCEDCFNKEEGGESDDV